MAKRVNFRGVEPFPKLSRASKTGAWLKRRTAYFDQFVPHTWAIRLARQFSLSSGASNYQHGLIVTMRHIKHELQDIVKRNKGITLEQAKEVYWNEQKKRYELAKQGVPLETEMEMMHTWLGDALYPELEGEEER